MPECSCSPRAWQIRPSTGTGASPELYAIIGSSLPDPSRHVSPLDVWVEPAHENAARLVPQQPPENVVVIVAPATLLPEPRHTSFTLLQSAPAAP